MNAIAIFTNRDDEQELFRRILDTPIGGILPFYHFYGVSGIGKSMLLFRLQENARALKLPTALIDLNELPDGASALVTALATLRSQLSGFDMPDFDVAFKWYMLKTGYANERPKLTGTSTSRNLIKVVSIFASSFGKILQSVLDLIHSSTVSELSKEIENMAAHEIRPLLVQYFVEGIAKADYPESIPDDRRSFQPKAVLLLDNFESLRHNTLKTGDAIHEHERWIYDLCRLNSRVLVVTSGRDKIRWGEIDPDLCDTNILVQYLIGGLSRIHAIDFLKNCYIIELPLVDSILKVSIDTDTESKVTDYTAHPFTLGLCANTVTESRRNGKPIDPSTFDLDPRDSAELARRFLCSLKTDAQVAWIFQLAATPRFDEGAARMAFSEYRSAEQDSAWHNLQFYSFVQPLDNPGWYKLHPRMIDALRKTDSDLRSRHVFWHKYWTTRSKIESDEFAGLAWYHGYQINPASSRNQWKNLVNTMRGAAIRMVEHLAILGWWKPLRMFDRKVEVGAAELNDLGIEYLNATAGDQGDNMISSIHYFQAAMNFYTRDNFPQQWARTMCNLGIAYSKLPTGNQGENLANAINCFQTALEIQTHDRFPVDWAKTMSNFGGAYSALPTGDRNENLNKALLCFQSSIKVLTYEQYPYNWAVSMNNIGNIYLLLPTGNRGDNLLNAIQIYNKVLKVHTRNEHPQEWAMTMSNLGSCYSNLPMGDHENNLANAINCYEAALEVRVREDFPQDWAATQMNLGNTYLKEEVRVEKAIGCFQKALQVYTCHRSPYNYALTQSNLGAAYAKMKTGIRADNLANAISCFQTALQIFTHENYPHEWARAKMNLGIAYSNILTGDRKNNLENSMACLRAALEVFNENDFPREYGIINGNMASVYADLSEIEKQDENRKHAIHHFEISMKILPATGEKHANEVFQNKFMHLLAMWKMNWTRSW